MEKERERKKKIKRTKQITGKLFDINRFVVSFFELTGVFIRSIRENREGDSNYQKGFDLLNSYE